MLIMRWKPFPQHKPKVDGWYQCTIEYGDENKQRYVMDLYWYGKCKGEGRWIDNRRQSIFDSYNVYALDSMMFKVDNKRLLTTALCDRTDSVTAWKKLPKPYKHETEGINAKWEV